MDKDLIKQNYMKVIVEIINYLSMQQSQMNTNEIIPDINEEFIYQGKSLNGNQVFNQLINMWSNYYRYQNLISNELLAEIEQGNVCDGILIADLQLCKKRLISEDSNKENSGYIRMDNTNGIYFEKKFIKNKYNL